MPSYNDFKCELRRYNIREAFNKLVKSLHLTKDSYSDKYPELSLTKEIKS